MRRADITVFGAFLARTLSLALTFTLVAAARADSQTTRAGQIAEAQAEKSKRLAPEQAGPGEKAVVRVLSSPLLTGAGGVYPWFGSVFPGSGFSAGIGYLHRLPNQGGLNFTAASSINGSLLADVDWRISVPRRSRLRPRLNARWIDANEVAFYGIGSRTELDGKTPFDYQPSQLEASLDAYLTRWLMLSGQVGYMEMSTSTEFASLASSFGEFERSISYMTTGAGITADWRTSPAYSVSGGFVRAGWVRHDAREQAPYTFDTVEVEAAQLVPLVREQYVLAFRVLATTTETPDGHAVPLVLLPYIGSGNTVRGFANRRFSDRSRALATAEYRWRPSRYLDMALFVDTGTVARRLEDLSDARLATSWGIGTRLHGPNFTALRVEAARGREGWRLVFAGGQPF